MTVGHSTVSIVLDMCPTRCAMEPLKIIVADDVPAFRYLVRKVFEPFSVFEVVGEAADGHSALEMTLRLLPHVCIMDVEMPRLSGMEATRRSEERRVGKECRSRWSPYS